MITFCKSSACSSTRLGKRVLMASEQVPVGAEHVLVRTEEVPVRTQQVLIGYEGDWKAVLDAKIPERQYG